MQEGETDREKRGSGERQEQLPLGARESRFVCWQASAPRGHEGWGRDRTVTSGRTKQPFVSHTGRMFDPLVDSDISGHRRVVCHAAPEVFIGKVLRRRHRDPPCFPSTCCCQKKADHSTSHVCPSPERSSMSLICVEEFARHHSPADVQDAAFTPPHVFLLISSSPQTSAAKKTKKTPLYRTTSKSRSANKKASELREAGGTRRATKEGAELHFHTPLLECGRSGPAGRQPGGRLTLFSSRRP